jgi:hypothetical protein
MSEGQPFGLSLTFMAGPELVWSALRVIPAARSARRGFKSSQSEGDFDIVVALKG